jgi:hypothetical protein
MKVRSLSECDHQFDFFNRRPLKSGFPVLAWGSHIITPVQEGKDVVSLNPNTTHLEQLIYDLYPDLSLMELARLEENLWKLDLNIFNQILEKYSLSPSENLSQTLDILRKAPEDFQNWAHEKRISVRDLAPLRTGESRDLHFILEQIVRARATRQQGVQILEIAAELFHSDAPIAEIMSLSEAAEIWLAHLKKMRYPMASAADLEMQNKIRALAWPAHVEAEWLRRGDQTGLQIKFFAQSQTELSKQLEKLKSINVWTN